jgi:hypothetical protein
MLRWRVGLLVFCSLAAYCGPLTTVVYRFDLSRQLSHTFSLPDSAREGIYSVTSAAHQSDHICSNADAPANFHLYWLSENNRKRAAFHVRLRATPSSRLEVAHDYLGPNTKDTSYENSLRPWAEIVARLVTPSAPVTLASVERLQSRQALDEWCSDVLDRDSSRR